MSYSRLVACCPKARSFRSAGKAIVPREAVVCQLQQSEKHFIVPWSAIVQSKDQTRLARKMYKMGFTNLLSLELWGKSLKCVCEMPVEQYGFLVNPSAWISWKMCHQVPEPITTAGSHLNKRNRILQSSLELWFLQISVSLSHLCDQNLPFEITSGYSERIGLYRLLSPWQSMRLFHWRVIPYY